MGDISPLTIRAQARIGKVLKNKWTIEKLLGVGGMAAVYQATHRNGKKVAIKILHSEISLDPEARQRFLREGYIGNKVNHKGAVTVDDDDIDDEDGSAFLVMELLKGESLDAIWEKNGCKMTTREVLRLMDQVLDTLRAAHSKGIVHRDLKPENLFYTEQQQVKILDFGIARLRELSQSSLATQTGSLMGTPSYMAPEQARGRWSEVDGRTDLWAVGAIMYTLITGQLVHRAQTVTEMLLLAMTEQAASIGSLEPTLHPAVVELIDKALAFDKEKRWKDAAAFQSALRKALRALQEGKATGSRLTPRVGEVDEAVVAEPALAASDRSPSRSNQETTEQRSVSGSSATSANAEAPPFPQTDTTFRSVAAVLGSDRTIPKPSKTRISASLAAGLLLLAIIGVGIAFWVGQSGDPREKQVVGPAASPEPPSVTSENGPVPPKTSGLDKPTAVPEGILEPKLETETDSGTPAEKVVKEPEKPKTKAISKKSKRIRPKSTRKSKPVAKKSKKKPKTTPESKQTEPATTTTAPADDDPFSRRY